MNSKTRLAHKLFMSSAVAAVAVSIPNLHVEASFEKAATESTILRYGHEGLSVRILQENLRQLGYYPYGVDGVYGNHTQSAVQKFQLHHGIKVDGIAGAKTLAALTIHTENLNEDSVPVQALKDSHLLDGTFLQLALNLIGTPYKWGGTTPNGFDCSGFIKYVFAKKGVTIPRTISEIWDQSIEVQKPSIGDLVFFETYKPGPSHAGIYLGGGRFIHSGSTKGVTISQLSQSYWSKRYLGSKRIAQYD